jgi:hypothetical protein
MSAYVPGAPLDVVVVSGVQGVLMNPVAVVLVE